jgi:hypothetical protein
MNRLLLGLVGLSVTAVAQANLLYTFDTDNQGWKQADFNPATLTLTEVGPATWNPAGHIEGPDFAGWAFHVSPLLAGGYGLATEIRFDYSADFADAFAYPFIVLASGTGAIYQEVAPPADGQFHTYAFDLTTVGSWKYGDNGGLRDATMGDIANVLGGLQRIGINADVASGGDFTRVDNVQLNAVPEPATMAALGLGIAALLRRRTR